jgi:hypothetical protein
MVAVQLVKIVYTKASRGAPGATVRNRLPRTFPLSVSPTRRFLVERYRLLEHEGFVATPPSIEIADEVPADMDDLVLEEHKDGSLELGLLWRVETGMPRRDANRRALQLRAGATARLITNGRHTGWDGQWYTEVSYNVALGEQLEANVFLLRPPSEVVDFRADLF